MPTLAYPLLSVYMYAVQRAVRQEAQLMARTVRYPETRHPLGEGEAEATA